MKDKLENLLIQLEATGIKGRSSSKSHLKSALYDWRVENNWSNSNALVLSYEDKGYAFITFTKREPLHCTLRHIFTLEQHRGTGVGNTLLEQVYQEMQKKQINTIRFFADLPSVKFYESRGYSWHGLSKTGLPFTYTDINTMKLVDLPKSQKRYVITS